MAKPLFVCCILCLACYQLRCQELEPRIYAALPKNMNTIVAGYMMTRGSVVSDPALPISGLKMTSHSISTGYLRTFALGNKLGRVQVGIPFTHLSGSAKINGHDTSGARTGFGDMRFRFSVNLTGGRAYDKSEFRTYTQKTVFGVSFVATIPTGIYHRDKRINIGTNRWGFKPEVGISKRINRFYTEAYAGVWFYTDNNQYLTAKTLTQDPVFSLQAHACYYFKNQMWLSVNTTWFNGGETKVDGVRAGDLLDNWRVGGTWTIPLSKGHSLKLQYHVGAFTVTGYDYNAGIISYQYIFF